MIARFLEAKIRKSPKSVLLLGPRQVGKSTLMNSLLPDMEINLARRDEFLAFSRNTTELEERLEASGAKLILIDEIQRIPDVLNSVQGLIDQKKGHYKFLLTGSSARKLRRGSANLLPGRIFTFRLGPLSCLELDFKMRSDLALEIGTLPEPYLSGNHAFAEKLLLSYAGTYLQEEILAETMLRDIQGFSRFLAVVAENSGKFLDFSKLANHAQVSRSAARRYYEVLEDTLLCDRVDAFDSKNSDLVKHPKYYLFDLGVLNGLLGNFKASGDRRGLAFEHMFLNQLKNTAYALDERITIRHFRTRGGLEVDFLVARRNKTFAVELKTGEPALSELRGLRSIHEHVGPKVEKMVACLKCVPKRKEGIEILPWQAVIQRVFGMK